MTGFDKLNVALNVRTLRRRGGSFLARLGATAYASTETTFYVLAVYFGSVGVKKARHAVVCGLLADIVSLIAAVFICRMVFAG